MTQMERGTVETLTFWKQQSMNWKRRKARENQSKTTKIHKKGE